ncbi:MAG: polysaccharide biosynthesis/export family protein [Bacteroidales bacterium]|nr:polysaccharide biosynthesis/export family protein [Bacteroidales bacterium]
MKQFNFSIITLLLIGLMYSCQSSKNIIYVQNAGAAVDLSKSKLPTLPEILIKSGDNLMITVSTYTAEVSAPFNSFSGTSISKGGSSDAMTSSYGNMQGYLVDNDGFINFPVLGKIKVVGLSKRQIEEVIYNMIYPKYVKETPIVMTRISNFKITILGDVSGNKIIPVTDDRITIFEAIAQAGDLQLTGKRNNVLLIRENLDGNRETYRIDLRDRNLIESPFYYLQQNDLLYIEPNNNKVRGQANLYNQILSYISPLVSIASIIVILRSR